LNVRKSARKNVVKLLLRNCYQFFNNQNICDLAFYHAMLYIARTMLLQDVCPSICLSICSSHAGRLLILSKWLNLSKLFTPSGLF